MPQNDKEISLETVKEKFALWRRQPGRPHRIPDGLWKDAIALTNHLPFGRVLQELKLDYTSFKRRLATDTEEGKFIELKMPEKPFSISPLAEIVSSGGATLRLFSSDTGPIIQAFLAERLSPRQKSANIGRSPS